MTNSTSGYTNTYMLGPFWGTWKTYGPFCAPEGTHTVTFTSDANPSGHSAHERIRMQAACRLAGLTRSPCWQNMSLQAVQYKSLQKFAAECASAARESHEGSS